MSKGRLRLGGEEGRTVCARSSTSRERVGPFFPLLLLLILSPCSRILLTFNDCLLFLCHMATIFLIDVFINKLDRNLSRFKFYALVFMLLIICPS